jgi:hypothetical protein
VVDAPTEKPLAEPTADDDAGARAAQRLTKNVLGSIVAFVLASGLVSTAVGTYFTWRNFAYQSQLTKIQNDAAAAQAALELLDSLLNEKWMSTYDMNDAVKTRASGDKLKKIVDRFDAAEMNWSRAHHTLAAKIAMSVDAQFQTGVPSGFDPTGLDPVWNQNCTKYALAGLPAGSGQPLPVGYLLEIVYNCQSRIKTDIDKQMTAYDATGSRWASTPVEPDPGGLRLSHSWWVDLVLQCLMVERLLAIRDHAPDVPYYPLSPPPEGPAYSANSPGSFGEDSCVKRYADDKCYGSKGPLPDAKCESAHKADATSQAEPTLSAPATK